jgi:hypothetical protein
LYPFVLLPHKVQNCKILVTVRPAILQAKTGFTRNLLKLFDRVLMRVFGANRFACTKIKSVRPNLHALVAAANQTDIHAIANPIVKRAMFELFKLEIGPKFTINPN